MNKKFTYKKTISESIDYDKLPASVWVYVAPEFILGYDDEDLEKRLEQVELQYQAQKSLILGEILRRQKK